MSWTAWWPPWVSAMVWACLRGCGWRPGRRQVDLELLLRLEKLGPRVRLVVETEPGGAVDRLEPERDPAAAPPREAAS